MVPKFYIYHNFHLNSINICQQTHALLLHEVSVKLLHLALILLHVLLEHISPEEYLPLLVVVILFLLVIKQLCLQLECHLPLNQPFDLVIELTLHISHEAGHCIICGVGVLKCSISANFK